MTEREQKRRICRHAKLNCDVLKAFLSCSHSIADGTDSHEQTGINPAIENSWGTVHGRVECTPRRR
jgi:hypothetical protein